MTENTSSRTRRLGRTIAVALGLSMAVAVQAAPAGASGTDSFTYSLRGEVAEAQFISFDPSGCIVTNTYVSAVDGRVRYDGGRPDQESRLLVTMSRYDNCTFQPILYATGFSFLPPGALEIDRMDGATLATTAEMFDFANGAMFSLDIELAWTGTGEVHRQREHSVVDYPGFRVHTREAGTVRTAQVVGVVSDGTANYATGFAPFASLGTVHNGEVTVIH